MDIKIISVDVENKGKYDVCEVTYKNLSYEGKVESKKVMSFTSKEVFDALKKSSKDDTFTVERKKDDKGYWQWIAIGPQGSTSTASAPSVAKSSGATPAPKSTYETPEERAKKQVYIVRQSSISSAIDTLKTDKKNPTVEEVLDIARKYEQYVFGIASVAAANELPEIPPELQDDIPY